MPAFQIPLFDFGVEVDNLAHLRATRERLNNAERAPNTVRAYTLGWSQFSKWCAYYDRDPLPATSDTIQLFIAALIERGRRMKTVQSYISGIIWKHASCSFPSPIDGEIRTLMRNARRELKEKKRGKAALTPDQLREICGYASADPRDVRDRALFILGFACGWRGSEIVSLDLGDLEFQNEGVVVYLGASKTDQEGKGRIVGLHHGKYATTCPVQALRDWLKVRGDWPGPLFVQFTGRGRHLTQHAITRETVAHRLQAALKRIGVDPTSFGSHSLRIGMVTASSEAGYTIQQIMGRTGQKTSKTVEGYIRRAPGRVFRVNPLADVI